MCSNLGRLFKLELQRYLNYEYSIPHAVIDYMHARRKPGIAWRR